MMTNCHLLYFCVLVSGVHSHLYSETAEFPDLHRFGSNHLIQNRFFLRNQTQLNGPSFLNTKRAQDIEPSKVVADSGRRLRVRSLPDQQNTSDSSIRAASESGCSDSGNVLTTPTGNITVTNFKRGKVCSWIIAPKNASRNSSLKLQFTNVDLNAWVGDSVLVSECFTLECAPEKNRPLQRIGGWIVPMPIFSSTGIVIVELQSGCMMCTDGQPSAFSLFYEMMCPEGQYGPRASDCKLCMQECPHNKILEGHCESGSTEDMTRCICPSGQYSENIGSECIACVASCSYGQVVSDFHSCPAGSVSNTMKCSKMVMDGDVYIGIKEAVNLLPVGGVLHLSPGYYTGSANCNVKINQANVTIRGTGRPEDTVIDCANRARHFVVDADGVRIEGLHLVNGKAHVNAKSNKAPRQDNHTEDGGCVLVLGNKTVIKSCIVSNCTAGRGGGISAHSCSISLINCTLMGNVASDFGGGIAIFKNSNLTLSQNMSFISNAALTGGGIYAQGASIDFDGAVTFCDNNASRQGGGMFFESYDTDIALHIPNGTFSGNLAGIEGGAIHSDSNLHITGATKFLHNGAGILGGGICMMPRSKLIIDGAVEFNQNEVGVAGGAIFLKTGSTLQAMDQVSFSSNKASVLSFPNSNCYPYCSVFGGAIYASYNCSVSLSGQVTLHGNYVENVQGHYASGGAVYIYFDTILHVQDEVRFTYNYAGGKEGVNANNNCGGYYCDYNAGGAISALGSGSKTILAGHSVLKGNSATIGGAIYASYGASVTVTDHCRLIENRAIEGRGGAISLQSSQVIVVGEAVFEGNEALNSGAQISTGGAIDSQCPDCFWSVNAESEEGPASRVGVFVAENSSFIRNKAQNFGGALWIENQCCTSSTAVITDYAVLKENVVINGSGGAVWIYGLLDVTGSALLVGNSAGLSGGGIFADQGTVRVDKKARLVGNQAANVGGAIYAGSGVSLILSGNVEFDGNFAATDGGGVFTDSKATVNASEDVIFFENIASGSGGALSALGQSVFLSGNIKFQGNVANQDGGAIVVGSRCKVIISNNVSLLDNHARGNGGAIFMTSRTTLFISGDVQYKESASERRSRSGCCTNRVVLSQNVADSSGGAIYVDRDSSLVASKALFSNNLATIGGGAIYVASALITLQAGCRIFGNVAARGGAVSLEGGASAVFEDESELDSNTAKGPPWRCTDSLCSGGAVFLSGSSTLQASKGCMFQSNRAQEHGGAIWAEELSVVSLAATLDSNSAGGDGGAIASIGLSLVNLISGALLCNNTASERGGGAFVAGAGASFGGHVRIEGCTALNNGGAIFALAPVNFSSSDSSTAMVANRASSGGAVMASGSKAILQVNFGHFMSIRENIASENGGGVAFEKGAVLRVLDGGCTGPCQALRGNGICNPSCMTFGCNWDDGDCIPDNIAERSCDVNGSQSLPVCRALALHFFRNKAGKNGGGAFQSACLEEDKAVQNCFFAGLSATSGASTISFEGNVASGAGGAAYTSCQSFDDTCEAVLNSKIGMAVAGLQPSTKVQFSSNRADLYGASIATAPSTFVMLGEAGSKQIELCKSMSLLQDASEGHLSIATIAGAYENSKECAVIIAPYGATDVSLILSEIVLECSTSAAPKNSSNAWSNSWKSGTYEGECSGCQHDSLVVEECSDRTCAAAKPLATVCGSGQARWINASYYMAGIPIVARTGIMKVRFISDSTVVSLGVVGEFSSEPKFNTVRHFVPGQDVLSFSVIRIDGIQSLVPPGTIGDVVLALLCATSDSACSMFNSLVPAEFFGFGPDSLCRIEGMQKVACAIGMDNVSVQVSLVNSDFPPLIRTIPCLPCQPGQSRKHRAGGVWLCESCLSNQYVIDPNNPSITCQNCPQGAICDGSSLRGIVSGSVWEPNRLTGQYILMSCPKGYQFVNSTDRVHFSHSGQQCIACASNQYILNSNDPKYSCQQCPLGAICDGSSLTGLVKDSIWEPDLESGQYVLKSCPKGHRFVNSTDGLRFSHSAQQCVACGPSQYILNSNNSNFACQQCPVGATCDGSLLQSLVAGAVWEPDYSTGQYRLLSCPLGYELLKDAGNAATFSYINQQCGLCPVTYFCTGGTSSRTLCPSGTFSLPGANASTACTPVVYLQVTVSLPISTDEFTNTVQQNFTTALAEALGTVIGKIVVLSVKKQRRSEGQGTVIISNVATDDEAKANDLSSRINNKVLNAALLRQGLPPGSLMQVTVITQSSPPNLTGMIVGATVATIVFVSAAVGAMLALRWRAMRGASRRLIGAKAGTEANQGDLPYQLREKYQAVKVLGCGAYGVVIEAWQLHNKKRATRRAVKVIHSQGRQFSVKDIRRLDREASLMSRLICPHIVQYVESCMSKQRDVYWIVMELLSGDALDSIVEHEILSEGEVIKIGMDICLALKSLHSIGVIHRDIKPANIIRTQRTSTTTFATSSASGFLSKNFANVVQNVKNSARSGSVQDGAGSDVGSPQLEKEPNVIGDGTVGDLVTLLTVAKPATQSSAELNSTETVRTTSSQPSKATGFDRSSMIYKLIDLGTCVGVKEAAIEAGVDASSSLMTFTDMNFAGTPAYASPENFIDPGSVSFSTDVWSLAATLFHLVSGQLPFDASSPIAASISIAGDLNGDPPDVRDAAPEHLRSNISNAFAEVLKKGLQKRTDRRFKSIDEMSTALLGCLVQRGEEMYSAFISYRVFSEKYHAMMLYEVLNNTITPSGHRVIVYLDSKRLVKGEDWEEGFSLGLLNSLVALPLMSEGVLAPMTKLTGDASDRADNVCKELMIMQALLGQAGGKLATIYPILVGRPLSLGEPNYPGTGNFFKNCSDHVGRLVDKTSAPTVEAVREFLQSRNIPFSDQMASQSVKGTVQEILSKQGAQLWAHAGDLPAEEIAADSEIAKKLGVDPPSPPLDLEQLCAIKAEIRALVPDIHAVIDRALAQRHESDEAAAAEALSSFIADRSRFSRTPAIENLRRSTGRLSVEYM